MSANPAPVNWCPICSDPIPRLAATCKQTHCFRTWISREANPGHKAPIKRAFFPERKCERCPEFFRPVNGTQKRCDPCRAALRAKNGYKHTKPRTFAAIACRTCGVEFVPHNSRVKKCAPCKEAPKARVASALAAKERLESTRPDPRLACRNCEHASLSKASETGFRCRIEVFRGCNPYAAATFWETCE